MTCILTQFNKISKTIYKTKEELISLLTTDICYLYDTILLTEIDDFLNILLEDDTENGQDNLNEITNILVSRLKHIINNSVTFARYGLNNLNMNIDTTYIHVYTTKNYNRTTYNDYISLYLLFNWIYILYQDKFYIKNILRFCLDVDNILQLQNIENTELAKYGANSPYAK